MSRWREARAIVLLPCTVTMVVPALILWSTNDANGWGLQGPFAALTVLLGIALLAVGLVLVVWTIRLFSQVGDGTLAPWDPTAKLVVRGPYRHVRNPMISGVALVLAGEAAALGSKSLALWFDSGRRRQCGLHPARGGARSAPPVRRGVRRVLRERPALASAPPVLELLVGDVAGEDRREPRHVDVPAGDDAHDAARACATRHRRRDREPCGALSDHASALEQEAYACGRVLERDRERVGDERLGMVPHRGQQAARAGTVDERGQ